jgi:prepilin-type N-terminal cleavage/methylation domain-containing protein
MKHGFTLIELSIVLVIIGLIIGGVTVGQNLIRSSEINATVSHARKLAVAVRTFQLKYNQLPGDMNNATSYWPTDCVDDGATNPCDGDGDGFIESVDAGIFGEDSSREVVRAWQHLNLSDILPGNFDGNDDFCINNNACAAGNATTELTLPRGPLDLVYMVGGTSKEIQISTLKSSLGGTGPEGAYQRVLKGIGWTNYSGNNLTGAFTAPEQFALDSKVDDGVINRGWVLGGVVNTGCRDGAGPYTYELTSDSRICIFTFVQ